MSLKAKIHVICTCVQLNFNTGARPIYVLTRLLGTQNNQFHKFSNHDTEVNRKLKLHYRLPLLLQCTNRSLIFRFSPCLFLARELLRLKGRSGLAFNGSASFGSPLALGQQNHAVRIALE